MRPRPAVQELGLIACLTWRAARADPQDLELPVGLEPAESLGGFHHASGRPTQSHLGIPASFDVAADAADGCRFMFSVMVGAGERAAQLAEGRGG